jgi:transposase InsO family protein
MIGQMAKAYPVRVLCEVLDCPRSSYYYEAQSSNDGVLRETIEQVHARWPFYGYRRVTAQLKREGLPVNSKAVRRVMKTLDVRGKVGVVGRSTTNSKHDYPRYPNLIKDLEAAYPDHIWAVDMTYIWLNTRFIYLAVVIDVFTRAVRGWCLGRTLSHKLALTALQNALAAHGAPAIHHSDQGVQYAATNYVALLEQHDVLISMSAVGKPTQNAFVERFIRTFKEEHYDYTEYNDFDDACGQIAHWIEVVYNTERIHSAIDYLTPVEFEAAFRSQELLIFS